MYTASCISPLRPTSTRASLWAADRAVKCNASGEKSLAPRVPYLFD